MQKKTKNAKNTIESFLIKLQKMEMEMFAFCVITFEPIKIQNCSAPQNDRLNLSFMKRLYSLFERNTSKILAVK